MIKIVIVENQQIMLSSLSALLGKYDHMKVIAEVTCATELFSLLANKPKVDLIITDIMMPDTDGITMIAQMREKNIDIPVIVLSMLEDEKHSASAFKAGANAYLSKNIDVDEVLFAINTVMKGNRYFASELAIQVLERYHKQIGLNEDDQVKIVFSDREVSVMDLMAEGLTNQQIADLLFLSKRTVEGIRQSILEKTGAKNSAALIKYAILHGYIGL
ncbi:MAG: response regulator transcription factor [Pedobacter sp.]|nr:MAG: response regulator transcription factor [Pedobacter sp.]